MIFGKNKDKAINSPIKAKSQPDVILEDCYIDFEKMQRINFRPKDDENPPKILTIRRESSEDEKIRYRPSLESEDPRYSDIFNFIKVAPSRLGEDMMWIVGAYNQ